MFNLFFFNQVLYSKTFELKARYGILQDHLSGKILYEMEGVDEELAREAFALASSKIPVSTTFVRRI